MVRGFNLFGGLSEAGASQTFNLNEVRFSEGDDFATITGGYRVYSYIPKQQTTTRNLLNSTVSDYYLVNCVWPYPFYADKNPAMVFEMNGATYRLPYNYANEFYISHFTIMIIGNDVYLDMTYWMDDADGKGMNYPVHVKMFTVPDAINQNIHIRATSQATDDFEGWMNGVVYKYK